MPTTTPTTRTHHRGPAEAGAPRLAGLPGVTRVESLPVQVVEVERYDTDDLALAAAGIVLAVHPGDDARWRVVLPDGDGREEIRVPLPADAPLEVPAQVDELLRGVTRDRVVRPVGRSRTTRAAVRLHGERGVLAEVVHDHVTVATLGRSTDLLSWTEVEVRAVDAPEELLTAVAARLADDGLEPAPPAADAELDRLLRPSRGRRSRAGGRGSAGAVLLAHLARQVDRLAAEDLRVRRDEPDAVHQMRVASRRLRSALQAYRPLLDRRRTDPLVEALRRLGQVLAPARDAEVLRERVSAGLAALEPELRLGPVQAHLTRHFALTEAEARAAVLTELDGPRYAALRGALDDLLAHPPLTERAARPARRELPRHVARTGRRLERAMAAALDTDLPAGERETAVHSARK
ncbi:MAG: CYTH and CHAD domain-containing protein, partial [Pseudonocardiales bacterium]|nr:CYTH and CHAD domain-containing protein [Pseudonocardiales bacterium]